MLERFATLRWFSWKAAANAGPGRKPTLLYANTVTVNLSRNRMADLVLRAIGEAVGAVREAPEVNRPPGVVYAKCVLKYSLSGAWAFGTAYLIGKYNADPEKMINIFQKVALPAGVILMGMSTGCLKLSLQAESLSRLKELWKRYTEGLLQEHLCQVLLTPDLLKFADSREKLQLEVQIDKKVFQEACLDLMMLEVHQQSIQSGNSSLALRSLRRSLSDSNVAFDIRKITKGIGELLLRAETQANQQVIKADEVEKYKIPKLEVGSVPVIKYAVAESGNIDKVQYIRLDNQITVS